MQIEKVIETIKSLNYTEVVSEILEKNDVAHKLEIHKESQVLALMGKMGSGKSTVARILQKHYNAQIFSFGAALKVYAHKYSNYQPDPTTKPRRLYQIFGEKCKEVDPDIWIKLLAGELQLALNVADKPVLAVIDDLRFPQERLWAYENKIPVIKIDAPDEVRKRRMEDRGDLFDLDMMNDETEKWVDILTSEYRLVNKLDSMDQLERHVVSHYNWIKAWLFDESGRKH